jgi:hypothetical protein
VAALFIETLGTPETTYVVGYPHWVDSRLVAINSGHPGLDFAIFPQQIPDTANDPRPKMFFLNLFDADNRQLLQQTFPNGVLWQHDSDVDNKDFMIFFVPPATRSGALMRENTSNPTARRQERWGNILLIAALVLTLAGGAYLRLVGVNWDEDQHMHPDERFLSLVQASITPVSSISEYFNTQASSLNPANRGYTFFVYGTLPIFIVRYVGEALGRTDYHAITIVGRQLSALFDVFTVLLVFAVGRRLYNKWVGLLGAVFYALAVLPIQLSHFATVDTITNTLRF